MLKVSLLFKKNTDIQADYIGNNNIGRFSNLHQCTFNAYLFFDSEAQLRKSKEFNNLGMKVQLNRAFKSFFFVTKNNKKPDSFHEVFLSTQSKCAEVPKSPISKSTPHSPLPSTPIKCTMFRLLENACTGKKIESRHFYS